MPKSINERLDELDKVGSQGALARSIENLTSLIKSKSKKDDFVPSSHEGNLHDDAEFVPGREPPANKTRKTEPAVANKGKAHTSMGGNPEAKRPVSEEDLGKEDVISEEETEKGSEARIKKARKKGKGKVPPLSIESALKSLRNSLSKGVPMPETSPHGYDDEDDDEDYDDDDESGGDQGITPEVLQFIRALMQDPELMAMVEQKMNAGGQVPPHTHETSPEMMQRSKTYSDEMQKSLANDPRAEDLLDAIDASPALEALADHMVAGTARSLAGQDSLRILVKSMAKRQKKLEKKIDAVIEFSANLGKSLSNQEGMIKSLDSKPINWPNVGYQMAQGTQSQSSTRDSIEVNKDRLEAVLYKSMEDANTDGRHEDVMEYGKYLNIIASQPFLGARNVIERLDERVFEEYKKSLGR